MDIVNVVYGLCVALVVASVAICFGAVSRRGLVGLGFGLLSVVGAAVSLIFVPFAVAVAREGHLASMDFLGPLVPATIGLALFVLGGFFGLRRKRA